MPGEAEYGVSADSRDGAAVVAIRGRVSVNNAQRILEEIASKLPPAAKQVELDLSGVDYFDSGGAAILLRLREQLPGADVKVVRSTPDVDGILGLIDREPKEPPAQPPPLGFVERAGESGLQALAGAREFATFTGEVVFGLAEAIRKPRRIRWRDTWLYMQKTGRDALPIVSLISFLMGLISAFQAAAQLKQFGAEIYVANLVGLSITRELGPLMTAIIAAGRSGAAFAAEIGTMKVSEEVDALKAMGLDRTRFLVTPKVVSLLIMLPCLTLYSDVVGILGGLGVAVFSLEIPAQVYFRQMRIYMDFGDVNTGLIKSLVFGILIAQIGCLRGFQAETGAESVGRITTSAIVSSIFAIIVADAVFTVLLLDW